MEEELKHYGVVGMRWGARKNPSRAFGRASKKANTLNKKAAKVTKKNTKKIDKHNQWIENMKIDGKEHPAMVGQYEIDTAKYEKKNAKLKASYEHKQQKAAKWISSMEKTFKNTNVSDITQKDMIAGKDYAYMLRAR